MGNDYDGQEDAVKEVRALSEKAKGLLNHHLGNSLQAVLTEAQMNGLKLSEGCVHHILSDLETFGIRPAGFR